MWKIDLYLVRRVNTSQQASFQAMSAEQIELPMTPEEDTCYICHETQSEENRFIDPNPCNCRGTIKIHNTCFDILTSRHNRCGICRAIFLQNGYKKYYYPSGSLRSEGLLVNGLKTGLYQGWYHYNNQLLESVNYVDGEKNGLSQLWHTNGQLWGNINYVDGKMNGLCQHWHDNGQLWQEVNYVDGKLDGLYQCWHTNGQLDTTINYIDNILVI